MTTIFIIIPVTWFLLSQYLAWLVCRGEDDAEIIQSIHAGSLFLPAMLGLVFLAWFTWHLWRFAHYMRVPFIEQPTNNPMDYL